MAPVLTPEVTSKVQWISQMSVDVEPTAGRKTTIIGTIGKLLGYSHHCIFINASYLIIFFKGPNTNSVEMITQLRNAGLNVVRMNFSHGSYEVKFYRSRYISGLY
jgi:pyruvate kinase